MDLWSDDPKTINNSQRTISKSQTNPKIQIQNPQNFWNFNIGIWKLIEICDLPFGIYS